MNEEVEELLRDLFIGTTIINNEGEKVVGLHITQYNDGALLINLGSINDPYRHTFLVPSENIQRVQNRVMSVPSIIVTPAIESE